ncbi:CAP domain-containing protein [Chryseolinea lacunae]|uniref:SCP domain-containing protein n=1 Tax=Chryseolinea lacunae TaxID=2801331 RepID=A0ABS1KSD9_9BACT|nr:CAP domain-containing protein [Chryseolinea lacunae]MBL0742366.1 hypothetical protein [Chryseolinea lacunae]
MKMLSRLLAVSLLLTGLAGFHERSQLAPAVCVSTEEKKLYDLIMDYRREHHLESIPLSAKLSLVAQTHARDLSEHYAFDPKNKCNPHSWSSHGKWTSCCYTNDHKKASCMWTKPQEIAAYSGNGFEIAYFSSIGASAQEGLDGWKVSPGHNPLLINLGTWEKVKWKAIGIGIYKEYGLVWFGEVDDASTPENCL